MTQYFSKAFAEIQKDWGGYIVATLIYVVIESVLSRIYIGALVSGIFTIGYYYYLRKKVTEGKAEFADLFIAFKNTDLVVPSLLAGIIIAILTTLGTICLIIPGIILLAAFLFTYLIILDGEKDFWKAMMKSMDIAKKNWVEYCVFALLAVIIMALGVLLLGVGILVTVPIGTIAIVLAYEDAKKSATVPVEINPIIKEN